MKIAILAPEFFPVPPVRGGATETVIEEVSRQIPGAQVFVLGIADPALPLTETRGLRTYHRYRPGAFGRLLLSSWRLPFKQSKSSLYYWPYVRWAARKMRSIQPDVIWVHSRMHFVPWLRRAFPKTRIVLSLHNESNLKDYQVWNSNAINACDRITACSASLAETAKASYPDLDGKLAVLHNGVDVEAFAPGPDAREKTEALRRKLKIGDDRVILFAGRLVEEKGVHLLIEAFRGLCARHKNLRLVIVGSKTFSDPGSSPYIERLKELAKGCEDKIVFTGHAAREEMPHYFQMASALAFPSLWKEPFGMVVIEAMAAGAPVVAFNHGGPAEILSSDQDGILVPVKEGETGLEKALERILANPSLGRDLGNRARETAAVRFPWKKIARDFLDLALPEAREGSKSAVLIAESGSGFGGTAKYLAQLVPLIPKKYWDVHLSAYAQGPFLDALEKQGWKIEYRKSWRFPVPISQDHASGGGGPLLMVAGLLRLPFLVPQIYCDLKKKKIRVIHLNNEVLSHLPLVAAGRLAGCKILCHLHGWRPFTRLEKLALHAIDRLVCISNPGAAFFSRELNGREVVPVLNGMDAGAVPADLEVRRAAQRKKWGLEPDQTAAILPGRLVPWKGQEILLDALSQTTRIVGVLAGHDPSPDGYYLKHLKELVRQKGLEKRVIFLDWQEDVWALYAGADIVVHASTRPEPFGLVVLEAMLASKPVVATRAGGVLDMVEENETGLLVTPGDAAGLAAALCRYITDAGEAKTMAVKGRKRAEALFTMERNARQICELYQGLL
ncbi:MAG TPA: glycosyltransferase family 4 protein [Verrucomicrobiae bacterium]|nr:glycosyltransferase family 4 protein [Verrucomicrobiae bacterium]